MIQTGSAFETLSLMQEGIRLDYFNLSTKGTQ